MMLRFVKFFAQSLGLVSFLFTFGQSDGQSQAVFQWRVQRPGLWLPSDCQVLQTWLASIAQRVAANPQRLQPVVAELKALIENDTRIYLLAAGMYDDIPDNYEDPSCAPVIRNYTQMLQVMSHLLTEAPQWNEHENQVGLVGLPMHALLDWPMGTFHGFGFFLDPEVNAHLKRVLNKWGEYLRSPASAHVLNNSTLGWFGSQGYQSLTATANVDGSTLSFEELFVCDPNLHNHGFESWNAFFTREFRADVRPLSDPADDFSIANVCESTPFAISENIKLRDHFWIKGQPYSVQDMLGGDDLSKKFLGGTIYQAYLSSLSYHRWHSPVSGIVIKVATFDGTYFSEPMFEILETYGAFPRAPRYAQGYLTAVATRSVIYIQADNPAIGIVAVVEVGMSEVSSCEVTVKEGQKVKKGDEIGMFHFGGSTYCLLFQDGVKLLGLPQPGERSENVPVRSRLAIVTRH